MPRRWRFAAWCHGAGIGLGAAFGGVYLLRSEFMPYHAQAVGQEWNQLDARMQALLFGLLKAIGGGFLASSLAASVMLVYGFRRGELWTAWSIPAVGLVASLPALWAALYVQQRTSATTPWIAAALAIGLFLMGFVVSRPWVDEPPDG